MRDSTRFRALAVVVLGVALLTVGACHRHRTPTERADWMVAKVTKELALTDSQQAKLVEVKNAFLAARAQSRSQHDAIFDDAVAAVRSEQLDPAAVLQLMDRHQALQRQAAAAVVAKVAEFHASLNPDQRAKAAEHLARFRDRMHGHERAT